MQPKQRRLRTRDSKAQRDSGNGSNQVVDEHATIQVILPRRKAGQTAVDRDTVEPVILNRALLQSLFHLPLATASSRLGLSATSIKKVCRKIGIIKWPYKSCRKRSPTGDKTSSSSSTSSHSEEEEEEEEEEEGQEEIEEIENESEEEVEPTKRAGMTATAVKHSDSAAAPSQPVPPSYFHPATTSSWGIYPPPRQDKSHLVQTCEPIMVHKCQGYYQSEDVRTASLLEDYAVRCGQVGFDRTWNDNDVANEMSTCSEAFRDYQNMYQGDLQTERFDFWMAGEVTFDSSA
jgi:hypothetical protein